MASHSNFKYVWLVFSALTGHSDKKAERDCHGFYSAWARNTWIDAHATRTGRIIFKRPFPGHSVAALPAAIRPGKRTAESNPRVGVSRVASSIRIETIFSRRQSLQSALQPMRQVHRAQVFAVCESTCALKCPVLHHVISLNLPRCPARDIKDQFRQWPFSPGGERRGNGAMMRLANVSAVGSD
jgi:hypothetical protein